MTNDEIERLALQMARAIWKQMNFRGGDPTIEWDTLTPDMQQPILDSCRVGLVTVKREIENAAFERAARLHENINPASDAERLHGDPGAGAMGAVIEYRDKIRALMAKP